MRFDYIFFSFLANSKRNIFKLEKFLQHYCLLRLIIEKSYRFPIEVTLSVFCYQPNKKKTFFILLIGERVLRSVTVI